MRQDLKMWLSGAVIGGAILSILTALIVSAYWAEKFINFGLMK